MWATYPYQLHDAHSIGWEPVSFEKDKNKIYICAERCQGRSFIKGGPCGVCEHLPESPKFLEFVQRATESSEYTNWEYLNAVQLRAAMKRLMLRCTELQTQVSVLQHWFQI